MRVLIVTEDHKVQRKQHLLVAFYNFIRYNGTGERIIPGSDELG